MSNIKNYSYFFDFFTIWSQYFYLYSLISSHTPTRLTGRVLISMTSIYGSIILIGRGKETIKDIRKQTKLLIPNKFIDWMGLNYFTFLLDILAHGIPFASLFYLEPIIIDKLSVFESIQQILIFSSIFIIFEYFRGIDISKTYGLATINLSLNNLIISLFLFSIQIIPFTSNPQQILIFNIIGINQNISVFLFMLTYYHLFYLFGNLL